VLGLFPVLVVAPGLEAGAAVGKAPAAADDDEPDEIESGKDASGGEDGGEPVAAHIEGHERAGEEGYLERGEGDGKQKLGAAPEAGGALAADAGDDEDDLHDQEDDPAHSWPRREVWVIPSIPQKARNGWGTA